MIYSPKYSQSEGRKKIKLKVEHWILTKYYFCIWLHKMQRGGNTTEYIEVFEILQEKRKQYNWKHCYYVEAKYAIIKSTFQHSSIKMKS